MKGIVSQSQVFRLESSLLRSLPALKRDLTKGYIFWYN